MDLPTWAAVRARRASPPPSQMRQYCTSLSKGSGATRSIRALRHAPTASLHWLLGSPVKRWTRGRKKTSHQAFTSSSGNLLMIVCSRNTGPYPFAWTIGPDRDPQQSVVMHRCSTLARHSAGENIDFQLLGRNTVCVPLLVSYD